MEIDYEDVKLSHLEDLIKTIKSHYPNVSSEDISIYFTLRDVSITTLALVQTMGENNSPKVIMEFMKDYELENDELDEEENYTIHDCLEEAIRIVCDWEFNRCVKKENNFDYQKLITVLKKGLELDE